MTTAAYIALGSNVGVRETHIRDAMGRLIRVGRVLAVSELFETDAVGEVAQCAFINAAAAIETDLSPRDLLNGLLDIEREGGRDRSQSQRWGPRTIDLDLLLYGEEVIDEPGLTVPHPRMHERLFVLEPLDQIGAEVVHPVLGVTVRSLLTALRQNASGRAAGNSPTYDGPRSR